MEEKTLNAADLNHISEFGHNPLQLFDKEHEQFEENDVDSSKITYDPLNPNIMVRL